MLLKLSSLARKISKGILARKISRSVKKFVTSLWKLLEIDLFWIKSYILLLLEKSSNIVLNLCNSTSKQSLVGWEKINIELWRSSSNSIFKSSIFQKDGWGILFDEELDWLVRWNLIGLVNREWRTWVIRIIIFWGEKVIAMNEWT